MSRAINIDQSEAAVVQLCGQLGFRISAIEALISGGTRVVLACSEDAARLRVKLKAKIIHGPVRRLSLSPLAPRP